MFSLSNDLLPHVSLSLPSLCCSPPSPPIPSISAILLTFRSLPPSSPMLPSCFSSSICSTSASLHIVRAASHHPSTQNIPLIILPHRDYTSADNTHARALHPPNSAQPTVVVGPTRDVVTTTQSHSHHPIKTSSQRLVKCKRFVYLLSSPKKRGTNLHNSLQHSYNYTQT